MKLKTKQQKKIKIIQQCVESGDTLIKACEKAGITQDTLTNWRAKDPIIRAQIKKILSEKVRVPKIKIKTEPKPTQKAKMDTIIINLQAGNTTTKSCKAANITFPTFWTWKKEFKEFAARVESALIGRNYFVEDILLKIAKKGNIVAVIYFLKNNWPEKYNDAFFNNLNQDNKLNDFIIAMKDIRKNAPRTKS